MTRHSTHDQRVNELYNNPQTLIGLEHIVWKSKEIPLYQEGQLAYQADIIFVERNNLHIPQWIIIEYKCNDSPKQRQKAEQQLHTAQNIFNKYLNENPTLLYIHGRYHIQEIK